MADELDLKVHLTPDFQDVIKQANDLKDIINNTNNSKLQQQLNGVEQKIQAISALFDKDDFGREAFTETGKAIQSIYTDFQKIGSALAHLDLTKDLKEQEKILEKTESEIDSITKKIEKSKTQESNTKNKIIKSGDVKRSIKSGGKKEGVTIASYGAAQTHIAALEEAGKTNTEEYKKLKELIAQADNEAKKIVESTKDYEQELIQVKKTYEEILDKITKVNAASKQGKQTKEQQVGNKVFTDASLGRVQVTEHMNKGIAQYDRDKGGDSPKSPVEDIKALNNEGRNNSTVFGQAVKNLTSYTLVLGTMKSALRSALETVRMLDKSLTEQSMVTGKTRKEMEGLLVSYQNIARQTGATTKEVAGVATEYFRQGKSAKDALVLTEAAVAAAKVGAISTSESVDYLTTAINGFGMAAEDAMEVSDRFAALAAASATNYEELAVALSKCASQANLAGMSMDFTLGLLAKGIETTREAPETIGTALKTIIARMREMTDYGKTLDGESNVNNLEKQLGYVGIALRNQQGELRSTQAVLDEIGRSWDTFSANQQAALAKALAGTRQQSRLISMMQNYDRTLELVSVSERSAGATATQMSAYMNSLEAATNNVSVAWEKLITTLTDTDLIIEGLQLVSVLLERFTSFVQTDFGQFALVAGVVLILQTVVGLKMRQWAIQKETLALTQKQTEAELKTQKIEEIKALSQSKNTAVQKAALKALEAEARLERAITTQKDIQLRLANGEQVSKQEQAAADKEYFDALDNSKDAQNTLSQVLKEQEDSSSNFLQIQNQINEQSLASKGIFGGISGIFMGLVGGAQMFMGVLTTVFTISGAIYKTVRRIGHAERKNTKEKKKGLIIDKLKAAFGMADSAAKIPVAGWVIALTILAAMGAAVGVGIAAAAGAFEDPDRKKERNIEKTTQEVSDLSAGIVKLTKSIDSINSALTTFDELDSHIIKTEEDTEKLQKALDAAAESLTEDERKEFNNKQTLDEKREYLELLKQEKQKQITHDRNQQLAIINNSEYTDELLDDARNQAVIYDMVTDAIWRQVEALKGLSKEQQRSLGNVASGIIKNYDVKSLNNQIKRDNKNKVNNKLWDHANELGDLVKRGIPEYAFHEGPWTDFISGSDQDSHKKSKQAYEALTAGNYDTFEDLVGGPDVAAKFYNYFGFDPDAAGAEEIIAQKTIGYVQKAGSMTVTKKDPTTGKEIKQQVSSAAVLTDANSSFKDNLTAYNNIINAMGDDEEAKIAFRKDNAGLAGWSDFFNTVPETEKNSLLNWVSDKGVSANAINDFTTNAQTQFGLSKEEGQQFFTKFANNMHNQDFIDSIRAANAGASESEIQRKILRASAEKALGREITDEATLDGLNANYSHFVASYTGTSQTASQEADQFKNNLSAMYSKQLDYQQGKLRGSAFTQFVAENGWFFNQDGAYDAFVNGGDLSKFLGSDATKAERDRIVANLDEQIATAERDGDVGLAASLREQKKELEDLEKLTVQSLDVRLKKEKAFVEHYKKLKEEERDKAIEVLEEKKKAYQEYFAQIDKEQAAEDYDTQKGKLLQGIKALGAGSDANSKNKRLELEAQLKSLEQERLKTLKEEVRNKMIEDIDKNIEDIKKDFDEMLGNTQGMLTSLANAEQQKTFIHGSINNIMNNKELSDREKASALDGLLKDSAPFLSKDINWDDVAVSEDKDGNIVLNIGGDTYELGSKEDNMDIWTSIKRALEYLGIK